MGLVNNGISKPSKICHFEYPALKFWGKGFSDGFGQQKQPSQGIKQPDSMEKMRPLDGCMEKTYSGRQKAVKTKKKNPRRFAKNFSTPRTVEKRRSILGYFAP